MDDDDLDDRAVARLRARWRLGASVITTVASGLFVIFLVGTVVGSPWTAGPTGATGALAAMGIWQLRHWPRARKAERDRPVARTPS